MIIPALEGLTLAKGHCGGADLIFVPDLDGSRKITDEDARLVCDRARGIGGGGLVRAVTAKAAGIDSTGEWYADVLPARKLLPSEIALYAHYLRLAGLIDLADGDTVMIATSEGGVPVTRSAGAYTVSVPFSVPGGARAAEQGYDTAVTARGIDGMRGGLQVQAQVPHVVVALAHHSELADIDLSSVATDPETNAIPVFVVPDGEGTVVDVDGVSRPVSTYSVVSNGDETLSDVAAAAALKVWAGPTGPSIFRTGRTEVRVYDTDAEVTISAEIVGEIQLAGLAGEA